MVFKVALYILVYGLCLALFALVRSRKVRIAALLAASYLLYVSWSWWFALVLLASTALNFLLGRRLREKQEGAVLALGVLLNLLVLGTFKYLPGLLGALSWQPVLGLAHWAMPLGISFWTFQALSYLFDQYREEDLDPSFFEFAAYMAFFPVVISGPVCRMPEMLPQLRSEQCLQWAEFVEGARRALVGVLMLQVARLLGNGAMGGEGLDWGFDQATQWGGSDVWVLAVGYGLQLYFNFAGFTAIVVGASKSLGFAVPENFAQPFRSTTPSIFWTRWHMSLSFWIRDYVFLPAAMMRRDAWWRNFALVGSMVLFGLWHKGTLLFALWGLFHGILLLGHRLGQQLMRKLRADTSAPIWEPLSWLATMALVNLGWVLFRAGSPLQARQMFLAVITPSSYPTQFLSGSLYLAVLAVIAGCVATMLLQRALDDAAEAEARGLFVALAKHRDFWLPALYVVVVCVITVMASGLGGNTAALMYSGF